jgi:O-antigen ligase
MNRASRLIVITSILVAGAVHVWLVDWMPWFPAVAAAVFGVTFVAARVSLSATLVPVLLTSAMAPALLYIASGRSDYHLTAVWLAALAGPLVAHAGATRWHLPARWAVPFGAWALVLALSWPIVAARELDFSMVAANSTDTVHALSGATPRMTAAWVVLVASGQMIGIVWLDLLWGMFATAGAARFGRLIILPLVASAVIGSLAGVYQMVGDIHWLNTGIWPRQERAGGLMLDANTFGIGAAMWAPAAVALAWSLRWPTWIGGVVYAVLALGMWASGSRTALLALIVGTTGLLVAVLRRRGAWRPRIAIALAAGGAIVLLALAITPRGDSSTNPLRRVADRLPRMEGAELTRFVAEMWDRFGYGAAAARMTMEHPLTGVGVGSFHLVGPEYVYRATSRRLPPDNAQNWWRHQVAELGLAGALPALWISALIVLTLWRVGARAEPAGVTTVISATVIGVGMASLLGVPTQHPASWLAFVTLLVWLLMVRRPDSGEGLQQSAAVSPPGGVPHQANDWSARTQSFGWVAAFGLAIIAAGGQWLSAHGDLRVPVRAARTEIPYGYGLSLPDGTSPYGDLRWAARRAVAVVPIPDRWVRLTVWPAHGADPDGADDPVTVRVWLNGRLRLERTLSGPEPQPYVLEMPEGARWVALELEASRDLQPGRALRVAATWHHDAPAGVPDDHVIPRSASGTAQLLDRSVSSGVDVTVDARASRRAR